jgi:hypothetical protein
MWVLVFSSTVGYMDIILFPLEFTLQQCLDFFQFYLLMHIMNFMDTHTWCVCDRGEGQKREERITWTGRGSAIPRQELQIHLTVFLFFSVICLTLHSSSFITRSLLHKLLWVKLELCGTSSYFSSIWNNRQKTSTNWLPIMHLVQC